MPIERTKRQTRSLAQTFQYREDSDAVYIEGYLPCSTRPMSSGRAPRKSLSQEPLTAA